ncbi:MAG: DNA topoisomerase, partial [Actinomycetota bacterium]|nr:DNA topoisomerase [Actinomycetota bacterium]
MRLIVSEKNIAARRIAEILAVGKPKADKVYQTPVYRFRRDGEDWVSIGLKGHIMKVDFADEHDGVSLRTPWDLDQLKTMVHAPVVKFDAEKGIIRSLNNLAKKAESVIIATDFDREGELIGSDARAIVLGANPDLPITRARFSAITKEEIERAFTELGMVSDELAEAGATRQDIDLIWGAVMTRYLTLSSNKASKRRWGDLLSAGRVQTPTLKLIVDREAERDAFVPETYWQIKAALSKDSEEFTAGHATDRFKDGDKAAAAMAAVKGVKKATVTEATKTKRQAKPPAPFNTTALMAAAANEGLSPARTMRIAEGLYMDGIISYPRVDNTVYPSSLDFKGILKALSDVPVYSQHANALLRKGSFTPTRGKKETTDHPPIHPTAAADPERLKPEQWKLYNLISRRFMATLSEAALIEGTKVSLDVNGEPFVAKGDVIVKPGYRAIYHDGLKKDEQLPALHEG